MAKHTHSLARKHILCRNVLLRSCICVSGCTHVPVHALPLRCDGGWAWGLCKATSYSPGDANTILIRSGNELWGGTEAASGLYFLALQKGAFISQTVQQHTPGHLYRLAFQSARRQYYPDPTLHVSVAGQRLKSFVPSGSKFWQTVVHPLDRCCTLIVNTLKKR